MPRHGPPPEPEEARRVSFGASAPYAPFRDPGPLPPREWIALNDGTFWDTGPQGSPDGRLIYFASARRAPALLPFDNTDLFVARDQILFSLGN